MAKNLNYYSIAINDLLFMQQNLVTSYFNPIAVQAQQIAEKLLKSVAELECTEVESYLKTHNLKKIYMAIKEIDPLMLQLSVPELTVLKDYYFEAKYPGEDFIMVSLEEANDCLETMYDVLNEVNKYRNGRGLKIFSFERVQAQLPESSDIRKIELFTED